MTHGQVVTAATGSLLSISFMFAIPDKTLTDIALHRRKVTIMVGIGNQSNNFTSRNKTMT